MKLSDSILSLFLVLLLSLFLIIGGKLLSVLSIFGYSRPSLSIEKEVFEVVVSGLLVVLVLSVREGVAELLSTTSLSGRFNKDSMYLKQIGLLGTTHLGRRV